MGGNPPIDGPKQCLLYTSLICSDPLPPVNNDCSLNWPNKFAMYENTKICTKIQTSEHLKEAGYSKVPEVISLQFNGFPILAFMRFPFINFRGSLISKVSVGRFSTFPYLPLWQLKLRKLSSWDQFPPIWDRLRNGMLRRHKIYCTLSP